MTVAWPAPLQPGDRLLAIAPSGCLRELDALQAALELWWQAGFSIDLAPHWRDQQGYLAGSDHDRLADLKEGWTDPHYRGLVCIRGGWGAARLLEGCDDWPTPPQPKWLVGFSDITTLLWTLTRQQRGAIHAPVLTTLAAEPARSQQRLWDCLQGKPLEPLTGSVWVPGSAQGPLYPANLTVATHLLGTPWLPDLRGAILAIEDVSEQPYRLDRLLTQWRLSGQLQQLAGIAVGRFSQCDPPSDRPSFTVEAVLRDRLSDLGIPVLADLPFGHDGENAVLPVGAIARIAGDRLQIHWPA
ncbi:S66 peptidase family protein [Synechococcus elongatus]|uniref:S66 peptidase family protein n=1 Tax=Synechococcus elongatus TaxID=32046 RepID=UPI000F7ED416|nr:LD-carboxypeptidase [Synechococcus elongatus]